MEEKLIEIMDQFSNGSTELVEWLTSTGFQSYVVSQVINHAVWTIVFLICLILIAWRIFVLTKRADLSSLSDLTDSDYGFIMILLICLAACSIILFATNLTSLIQWMFAPEGMILQRLV